MYLVGLTGGIGSGKSTVARRFGELGAAVVDADAVAREVVEPGEPAHREIVERFGDGILGADGRLDRPALAKRVFADDADRSDLEAITHPRIGQRLRERVRELAGTHRVVVVDLPLLVEGSLFNGFDAVVVVTCPEELRVERLVRDRGMHPDDVRARIAAQATDDERVAVADHVIDNRDDLDALRDRAGEVYAQLESAAGAREVLP